MKTEKFTLLSGLSGNTSQLDSLIKKFIEDLTKLKEFDELQFFDEPALIGKKVKSTVLTEQKEVHKKFEEIRENLIRGKYDETIFSEAPKITEEINIAQSKYRTQFIDRLLVKCNSDKALRFWIEGQKIPLPEDIWVLSVNLGANIIVLKYMKEKGLFDGLSNEDKEELLDRAKRFPGEGLNYLKREFSEKDNTLKL